MFDIPPQPEPPSRLELGIALLFLAVALVVAGIVWGGLLYAP